MSDKKELEKIAKAKAEWDKKAAKCEERDALFETVSGEPKSPRDLRGLDNLLRGEVLANYMRYHGVYMPDLHIVFVSAVHTDEDADWIIDAFKTSLLEMREDGLL